MGSEMCIRDRGIGEVGCNIFIDTAQYLWPCLAPFVDPRSLKTAKGIGIESEVEKLWDAVGKDHKRMARLCVALTNVRLNKKEGEFK